MAYKPYTPTQGSGVLPVKGKSSGNLALTAIVNGTLHNGVTYATNDKILLTDQTTASQNGIWTVNASGTMTRSPEMADGADASGVQVFVKSGGAAGTTYSQISNPAVVGTNSLSFNALSQGSLAESGESVSIGNNQAISQPTFGDVTGGSFTLPSAVTWEVTYNVFSAHANAGAFNSFRLVDSANVQVVNSEAVTVSSFANNFVAFETTQTVRITTTGATVYKLQAGSSSAGAVIYNNAFSSGNVGIAVYGRSKIVWNKIGGLSPVVGQMSDYIYVGGNVSQTQLTTTDHVQFNVVRSSSGTGIVLDTSTGYTTTTAANSIGRFTLRGGQTYKLSGSPGTWLGGATYLAAQWYNADTNTPIGVNSGVGFNSSPSFANSNGFTAGLAETIFTPTVNTRVELRIIGNGGGITGLSASDLNGGPHATIQQIGSAAITQFTGATAGVAGAGGFVPAPAAGDQAKVLLGSGTWGALDTMSYVSTGLTNAFSIPNNVQTALTGYPAVTTDTLGAWNATTGTYTNNTTRTQRLSITGVVAFAPQTWTTATRAQVILSNGVRVGHQVVPAAFGDNVGITMSAVIELAPAATFTVQVIQNSGAARTIGSGQSNLFIAEIPKSN